MKSSELSKLRQDQGGYRSNWDCVNPFSGDRISSEYIPLLIEQASGAEKSPQT